MENSIDDLLESLNACDEAIEWAKGKTWQEIYNTCHRGDWLLWLFKRTNPNDLQLLTLAKGHCANTVRHLMKDDRSIKAVDAAISFGEGKIGLDELNAAADAVVATYYAAAYAAAAAAAAYADAAAYAAADAAADAADTASSSYASYAALKKNQQETADICRKYLPIEIWNIKFGNLKLK